MKKSKRKISFDLILAFSLAFVGGLLECYSLSNRGFFALMQTGNLISVFINIIRLDWQSIVVSLLVIFTFIFGLILSNLIEHFAKKRNIDYHPFEEIVSLILLIIVIFIPVEFNKENVFLEAKDLSLTNLISNMLLSLIGAMLLESFTKLNRKSYTATMMTANLQRMIHSFFKSKEEHDKNELLYGFDYLVIIVLFGLGVMSAYSYFYFLNPNFALNDHYIHTILPNFILFVPILVIVILLILKFCFFNKSGSDKKDELSDGESESEKSKSQA